MSSTSTVTPDLRDLVYNQPYMPVSPEDTRCQIYQQYTSNFLLKSIMCNFYVFTIWVCNFLAKGFIAKSALKRWRNWLNVSISPTFYKQLFHSKVFLRNFYVLTILVSNFSAKGNYQKNVHTLLVQLTTYAKFTNVFWADFCTQEF